jgi:hypothetical protein
MKLPDKQHLADYLTDRLCNSDLSITRWESCGRRHEYEPVSQEVLAAYIDEILNDYETEVSS